MHLVKCYVRVKLSYASYHKGLLAACHALKCLCLLFILLTAARDGWALSWRVLHHIQASKAWQTWYWCNSFFPIYSSEVKKKKKKTYMNKTCLKLLSVVFIYLSSLTTCTIFTWIRITAVLWNCSRVSII